MKVDVERISRYIGLTEEDVRRLSGECAQILLPRTEEIVGGVLSSMVGDEEVVDIVTRAGLSPERAKGLLREWLKMVLLGEYGEEHARRAFKIGLAHCRAGVPETVVTLTVGAFAREATRVLSEEGRADLIGGLQKALFWNLAIMLESYSTARKRSFERSTGIPDGLVERLIALSAGEIYEEMSSELWGIRGSRREP